MSYGGSGDEQSEDGELRQSPGNEHHKRGELLDFSLSDDDPDTMDGLDIKPPQAQTANQSKSKRKDAYDRHRKRERHREERHSHRSKHHRYVLI